MVNPFEIMPVLALALMIVFIPLLARGPPGRTPAAPWPGPPVPFHPGTELFLQCHSPARTYCLRRDVWGL